MSRLLGALSVFFALLAAAIALWASWPDTSSVVKLRRGMDADPVQRSMMDASPQLSGYRVRALEEGAARDILANRWIAVLALVSAVFGLAALLTDR